jgi:prephenate dehydrogenase
MFERIAIVGVGLIGGSLALAIRERWPRTSVVAIDRPDVVRTAVQRGAATAGGELSLAADADLIVLAAPVRQNILILQQLAGRINSDAIVTDVGSTKQAIVDAANALPTHVDFVGGHPLAGAATGGIEAAQADLFQGKPWILTPTEAESSITVRISDLVSCFGAVPQTMDAVEHDRVMAYLSHLPQLTVSALMHVVGERTQNAGLALAGSGLRDSTRLASSPASTWRDVTATNAEAVAAAIDELTAVLQQLKRDLAIGDDLLRVFDSAAKWKQALDQGDDPPDLRDPRHLRDPRDPRP